MLTPRELDRLTEGWPEDDGGLDLHLFAASFHADRPALSAPALDRIAARLGAALDAEARRSAPRPTMAVRLSAPMARVYAPVMRTLRAAAPADLGLRLMRVIPAATAAAVLLAMGVWFTHRPDGHDGAGAMPSSPHPSSATPVEQRPVPNQLPPEGPEFPTP